MKRERRLNITLENNPQTEADVYAMRVIVKTGGMKGQVEVKASGYLSIECTARLIRDLRQALRQIRTFQVKRMNDQILRAEGEVDG